MPRDQYNNTEQDILNIIKECELHGEEWDSVIPHDNLKHDWPKIYEVERQKYIQKELLSRQKIPENSPIEDISSSGQQTSSLDPIEEFPDLGMF